jgi:hypothetical protein
VSRLTGRVVDGSAFPSLWDRDEMGGGAEDVLLPLLFLASSHPYPGFHRRSSCPAPLAVPGFVMLTWTFISAE